MGRLPWLDDDGTRDSLVGPLCFLVAGVAVLVLLLVLG